jgi:protoporphyrinogen oxidase
MANPRVVVLGGGLSGLAVAFALAEEGWTNISLLERADRLGGLAGSFEIEDRFYPLGYHHILSRDRTLLFFLDLIGALDRVRWRKIRMLFETHTGLYDLSDPRDFWRFPLPLGSKVNFLKLMARAFVTNDWSAWRHRSGAALLDAWADPTVREVLFDPLVQLKFRLPCSEISAEWLGLRLSYREGAAPLGYMPDSNWTTVLCDGMEALVRGRGVITRTRAAVDALQVKQGTAVGVVLRDGTTLAGDVFVSTVPTSSYRQICHDDQTPHLGSIRYTALLSMVCATRQKMTRDFYWLNLATRQHSASGLFNLSALNPTIGGRGETCLNFVTHLSGEQDAAFHRSEDAIVGAYLADFSRILGWKLEPSWIKLSRVPIYSPIFVKDYQAPPVKSTFARNVYFAGNYSGPPSIASTGSAMRSGLETADRILADHGRRSTVMSRASAYRAPREVFRRIEGG